MVPLGNPASRKAWTISAWVRGQRSDDLKTTVLPQASGIATERTPRMIGAFHGAIARHTPTGWRMAKAIEPGRLEGMTSPVIWVVIAAASRIMSAASATLKCDQCAGLPVSATTAAAKSSAFDCRMSAAFIRTARRSPGNIADHSGKAAAAASAAWVASLTLAAAARVATSPVTGSIRSNVRSPPAATSRSAMISLVMKHGIPLHSLRTRRRQRRRRVRHRYPCGHLRGRRLDFFLVAAFGCGWRRAMIGVFDQDRLVDAADTEIGFAHGRVGGKIAGDAVADDAASLDQIAAIGNP